MHIPLMAIQAPNTTAPLMVFEITTTTPLMVFEITTTALLIVFATSYCLWKMLYLTVWVSEHGDKKVIEGL